MIKTDLLESLKEKIDSGKLSTTEVPVNVALKSLKKQIRSMLIQGWSYEDLAAVYSRELQTEISPGNIRQIIEGNQRKRPKPKPKEPASAAAARQNDANGESAVEKQTESLA